ncbi:pantoate--beta-alanine ligase [Methylonatrum kenyense]|uniref:pantoate--beta-alanine ligase n=1 Tax=Methylonatrum kenyense TaxID=455253 RepID=UPI0020BEE3CB|nr:pantoate--beta-alanine ligase [Methylonatrum kenyense]MCK8516112.1 pantoate--beta-alanine ligase [Methylonatrum kenyense]
MPFATPSSRQPSTASSKPLVLRDADSLRAALRRLRRGGARLALVPTMGNLHAGHLELVRLAAQCADEVVVSIFVNPLQFGPGEDFDRYPRTLDADLEALAGLGRPLQVFAPGTAVLYPDGPELASQVQVGGLSDILCGASRPGHFTGVATVVLKLLNLVQPEVAVFGRKDYQQLQVIRRMVRDLDVPVAIEAGATVREADGLALSSRNRYLNQAERRQAPRLYRVLGELAAAMKAGEGDLAALEQRGRETLIAAGMRPDYVSIRCQRDLRVPGAEDRDLVVLAAARLGETRLIDNLEFQRPR